MREETIKKIKENASKDFSYIVNNTGEYRESWRVFRIMAEFVEGYQFLSNFNNVVTILGSARLKEDNKYYQIARELGLKLAKNNFTVITGGGPGIMMASNQGAYEGGGESVGLNIQLPFEQRINPYVKKSIAFYYFFTRKVMLTSPANAFVYFPGGFGTMDEFFEVIDLIKNNYMVESPIILVGKEYWQPLLDFIEQKAVKEIKAIDGHFVKRWYLVETAEQAMKIIKKTKNNKKKNKKLTNDLILNKIRLDKHNEWRIFKIMAELVEGFEFLTGLVEDVTVLGTKSVKHNSKYFLQAYDLGRRLAKAKFAVVTGGGHGIMEAVNKGAVEMGGESIGINIKTNNFKERMNDYLTKSIAFSFPSIRKLIVTAPSKSFIFYPGGLGTLHQLFEVLTLIQTGKMQKIPVLLYDTKYWGKLVEFINKILVNKFATISSSDPDIFKLVDSNQEIVKIVKKFRK